MTSQPPQQNEERRHGSDGANRRPGFSRSWLSLVLGIAMLAGVAVVATHLSEEEAFLRLAQQANPWWMIVALVLQAATYLAQGEIWRMVGRRTGTPIRIAQACRLALAKLFLDQALPSAGLSGTVVIAQEFERRGLSRGAVRAGVVVNATSFFIAYAVALSAALIVVVRSGQSNSVIMLPSLVFIVLSIALTAGILALVGRDLPSRPGWLVQRRIVQNALSGMRDADTGIVRNAGVQAIASVLQILTFLLDGVTLWVLVLSLGASASLSHTFASFMVANLVRTLSITPGGLGTFEAAAVLMLRLDGVSLAASLSAALLFRGLTFFLPMAPGLWFSRHLGRHKA